MVSPYFEGAESISGLGLPRFLGFGPGLGAETWWLDPNLGQKVAWEGPGRAQNPVPFSVFGPELLHPGMFGPQTCVIE